MCIYYLLHHSGGKADKDTNGATNCRTFMIGSVIYIAIYILLLNLTLKRPGSAGIFKSGLILLFVADVCAVSFLYKSHYGRSIIHEVGDNAKWVYEGDADAYRRRTLAETVVDDSRNEIQGELCKQSMDSFKATYEQKRDAATRLHTIVHNKNVIRACRTLQRWWRVHLYEPPKGIFYIRAQANYDAHRTLWDAGEEEEEDDEEG
jgi:hypothetical protein